MPKLTSAVNLGAGATSNHSASNGTVAMRVVLITMDSHLVSAAERATHSLNKLIPGLNFTVHAASEWSQEPVKLDQCLNDIAQGDIIICTMLFIEDHYTPILSALQARRDHCDAMVCAMSATDVTKLTRMGGLSMDKEATGLLGLIKKLRGKTKPEAGQKDSGQKQMKVLRTLPKILRFIPGTAQDARAYFLCMQYWLAGSEANIAALIHSLVHRYAAGPRIALRGLGKPAAPVDYPDLGLYHPQLRATTSNMVTGLQDLPRVAQTGRNGTVGLLLLRSYLLAGNASHYDGVITALEAKGLKVIPAFASGLDSRPAIEAYFMNQGLSTIDALVSLTGFSLVGGPAYNDARAAEEILAQLDVPYIGVAPVEFQTIEQWEDSDRGLMPVESTIMVAIPELDGATGSSIFGGRSSRANGEHDMCSHTERAHALSCRVAKLIALRRSERAERKVAIVIFNFPPNAGNTGTAAFLSVFESIFNTLTAMKAAGYTVDVPSDSTALRNNVIEGNAKQYGALANVADRVATDDHVRRETWLEEIEAQWGPAPGRHLSDGQSIFILGAKFGNVMVAIQPSTGLEGDPMRLLFAKGSAPTHAFSAFYRYLREDFAAHAILHFGTHGALEFMPGKQVGLSGNCWPDRLIGDSPNFYLYASNNPSEGAIAKRRGSATLISYLTPPVAQSGLYKGLADLKASMERYRSLSNDAQSERNQLLQLIEQQGQELELIATSDTLKSPNADNLVADLHAKVIEVEYTLIPHGLHVVGSQLSRLAMTDMLMMIAESTYAQPRLPAVIAALEALVDGKTTEQAAQYLISGSEQGAATWLVEMEKIRQLLLQNCEIEGLLRALDGKFIRPAPGADLLRSTAVLPTGRNLHGFDPFRIPSSFAVVDGARQAQRLLARHMADGNPMPETIALVLWGTDNLKSEGAPIGQALALMGAKPRFDSYGRLAGATLIPLDELDHPRIDTVLTLSGIFRDLLPLQIKLLAEAAFLAATAEEPIERNFIRKHVLAFVAENGGTIETAALRVFGNAEGAYGANVNQLIDSSAWQNGDELAETYAQRKGFAYGRNGMASAQPKLLDAVLAGVDLAYQNLESVELGVTTVDTYFDTLGGVSKAVQRAKRLRGAADTSMPVYISDQTQSQVGGGVIRTLSEQVALETRTRTLNPKWYEGLLDHGYEGVRQIEQHVANTMGWSATTGQVQPWIYKEISETFMLDPVMRDRLAQLNPTSAAKVASRLLEASQRQFWTPDAETLAALQQASDEIEDRLEGLFDQKSNNKNTHTNNNTNTVIKQGAVA
jgi:magnesium chelatase subunit H